MASVLTSRNKQRLRGWKMKPGKVNAPRLAKNHGGVHDSLESFIGTTGIGLSYGTEVSSHHLAQLESMNLSVVDVIQPDRWTPCCSDR